jgi:RHS repeat-associated protein
VESFVRQYTYHDALWRETKASTEVTAGGLDEGYSLETRYDANYGRVNQTILPGGISTYRTYTARGDLLEEGYVEDFRAFDDAQGNSRNAYLRRVDGMTARDQVSRVRLARITPQGPHGMLRELDYDASTGWLRDLETCREPGASACGPDAPSGAAPSSKPVHYAYHYDAFGNVARQTNTSWRPQPSGGTVHSLPIREDYGYDALHRLRSAQVTHGATVEPAVTYAYDAIGNLLSKSDFSVTTPEGAVYPYRYATPGKPHAVSSVKRAGAGVAEMFYTYDANGNMASKGVGGATAQRFQHDIDNRPLTMFEGGSGQVGLMFHYAPDGQRYLQHAQPSTQGVSDTFYLDKAYEREVFATGTVEERYYLAEGVLYIKDNRGEASKTGTYWVHTDRLGSSVSTTDAAGIAMKATPTSPDYTAEVRTFEAFGKARNAWAQNASPALGTTNPRGFTQHEHLDAAGLIHMNGRAYDPNLGRFLGVDPIIQFPTNSQSLNPYSYLMNSPLAGTDPTGYMQSICDHPSAAGGSNSCVSGMTTTQISNAVKDALASGGLSYTRRNGGGTVRVVLAGNGATRRVSGTGRVPRGAMRTVPARTRRAG